MNTFRVPLLLAVMTLVALVAALLDDGMFDHLAALALLVPLAAVAWARRRAA